jgi:hypothetical protein
MVEDIPKIILIDGLPGSGKSTSCRKVAFQLNALGFDAVTLFETQENHPLHVIPTDETGAAWPDIHLKIDSDSFANQSLIRWKTLLQQRNDQIYVIESFPFQSFIRVLFQMNTAREQIEMHWANWLQTITGLQARLIFFKESNPEELFAAACENRGKDWTSYMCDSCQQMPYAKSRGWLGEKAAAGIISDYAHLINALAPTMTTPKLVVESRPRSYEQRDSEISKFLIPESKLLLPG